MIPLDFLLQSFLRVEICHTYSLVNITFYLLLSFALKVTTGVMMSSQLPSLSFSHLFPTQNLKWQKSSDYLFSLFPDQYQSNIKFIFVIDIDSKKSPYLMFYSFLKSYNLVKSCNLVSEVLSFPIRYAALSLPNPLIMRHLTLFKNGLFPT